SPRDILEELNRVAMAMGCRGSALCFTLALDNDGNVWLSGATAGHPSLLIWHDGKFRRFPGTSDPAYSYPLGTFRSLKLVEDREQLIGGDWVIAFSDGVPDGGVNVPGGGKGGEEGTQRAAPIAPDATPESVATAILRAAAQHAKNRLHDDMTVVAIQVR